MTHRDTTVLVVDDEQSIRFVLERALGQEGFQVSVAEDLAAARSQLDAVEPDLVFLDVRLPDGSGLDLLPDIVARESAPHVVVMTARDAMDVAVRAMKAGARDFVVKPFDIDRLVGIARELSARPRAQVTSPRDASRPEGLTRPGRLIGKSGTMMEVFKAIGRIAPSEVTALLEGESGTGKELVARAIHDNSPRAGRPFITVNCAAIPGDLIESELFGHEKGSFTGASDRRKGKFELADGGTLFLDEVGELPGPLQAKLLRAIQERVIERVGGQTSVPVDVRIIAATHRDLTRMVAEGTFREDLFYRLNVVPLRLPPLRDRDGDVRLLAESFVQRWGPDLTGHTVDLADDAVALLSAHSWPGNVRELENVIKRALVFCRGAVLTEGDLAGAMMPTRPGSISQALPVSEDAGTDAQTDSATLSLEALVKERLTPFIRQLGEGKGGDVHALVMGQVERALLTLVLEQAQGNQLEASRMLGMNRNTLRKRIRELAVPMPAKRKNRKSR